MFIATVTDLKTQTNEQTNKTLNTLTRVLMDHGLSEDAVLHSYLRGAWKWLREILCRDHQWLSLPKAPKGWGSITSETEHSNHRVRDQEASLGSAYFISKLASYSEI